MRRMQEDFYDLNQIFRLYEGERCDKVDINKKKADILVGRRGLFYACVSQCLIRLTQVNIF